MSAQAHTDHPIFSLSPHTVYWLADGMRTRRGLEYWQRQRVLEFFWDKDTRCLQAVVLGTRRYRVTLDAVVDQLRCRCTCADSASGAVCKHAVAAAAAFFAVTRGTQFLNRPPAPDYLRELRAGIYGERKRPRAVKKATTSVNHTSAPKLKAAPPVRGIGLTFQENRSWSACALRYVENTFQIESWDPALQLTCVRMNQSGCAVGAVIDHLESAQNPYPVWLLINAEWKRIAGVDPVERRVSARLTRRGKEVEASFQFEGGDGASEVDCGLTAEAGLTQDNRLVRLEASSTVWHLGVLPYVLGDSMDVSFHEDSNEQVAFLPWRAPIETYNAVADIFFDEILEKGKSGVTFFDGDRKVTPRPGPSRLCLRFDRGKDFSGYAATLRWEGSGFSVPLETASETLDHIFALEGDRKLFANRERVESLAGALTAFAGEPDKKERKTLAREVAASVPQRQFAQYVRRIVRALESEMENSCHWVFAHAKRNGSPAWEEAELSLREVIYWELFITQLLAPRALRERFRGGAALVVAPETLSRGLAVLFEECRKRDVSLLLNGKPVGRESLEISVEVTEAKDKRDWFELKPEIRLAGRELSKKDWEAIAEGNGIAQTDTGPVVIDIDSLERLREARRMLRVPDDDTDDGLTFQVPRLRIFEWLDLHRLGVSLKLPAEGRKVLESLARFRQLESTPLPVGLRAELRDYQKTGYDWFAFIYRHRFGACLADDMGLGKTVQAIALMVALKEGAVPRRRGTARRPHLVVAPASLVFNWRAEIERFAPGLTVLEYTGKERSAEFKGIDVVLTTYETARRDRAVLREKAFHVLIFDEAQAVKNRSTARHRAVREISADCRLCLTGTPVENHLGEYRAILDLALPGIFDDLNPSKGKRGDGEETEQRVLARSRPFVLRRTKTAVLSQLPEKTETDVMLELAPRQKALYVREVARVREEVASAYTRMTPARAGVVALSALNRLRLLCVSPALLDVREKPGSPKFDFALEAVTELLDEGNAVLVFSQFVKALDLFDARLKENGVTSVRLEGKTTQKQRRERVQRFQSGEGPAVFLLSLKAGGVGLNLTRANHVIHLDPWWNPAVESQASDRAHRIGQERKVLIQRLSMRGTIEEKIAELKADKKALYQRVLGSNEKPKSGSALSRDDLAFLLDGEV